MRCTKTSETFGHARIDTPQIYASISPAKKPQRG
jgi:hypothetical protein